MDTRTGRMVIPAIYTDISMISKDLLMAELDSDSTGAICGNILGLVYGYEALPSHFKDQVELADIMTEVAEDLWNGCPAADADPELLNEWKRKYLLMDKT